MEPFCPKTIWVARHGQSAGNVARDAAEEGGLEDIAIAERDVDVPLSALGERQAEGIGLWFAELPAERAPDILFCSPYLRARQTGDRVHAAIRATGRGPEACPLVVDERLREKEFGALDRLTRAGIRARCPDLAAQLTHVGKFYFRPPGGESWCDVILRLRSFHEMLARERRGERVLIIAHQVVVNCLRYLLEGLDEATILALDRAADVPNCAITSYEFDPAAGRHGGLVLDLENFVLPLREAGAPVTAAPDVPAAPKPRARRGDAAPPRSMPPCCAAGPCRRWPPAPTRTRAARSWSSPQARRSRGPHCSPRPPRCAPAPASSRSRPAPASPPAWPWRYPKRASSRCPRRPAAARTGADMARIASLVDDADVILIGPGMRDEAATCAFAAALTDRPGRATIVLDALAIGVASGAPTFARPALLTPHAGELAHLTGWPKEAIEAAPERCACHVAKRLGAVVVLKGACTFIATPDGHSWRHEKSVVGLATSGSGDVLAGILAGLLARGAEAAQAAVWAVHLHSRAGQALARRQGEIGYLASELAAEIPRLIDELKPRGRGSPAQAPRQRAGRA